MGEVNPGELRVWQRCYFQGPSGEMNQLAIKYQDASEK